MADGDQEPGGDQTVPGVVPLPADDPHRPLGRKRGNRLGHGSPHARAGADHDISD